MTDEQLRQKAIAAMRKVSAAFKNPEALISQEQIQQSRSVLHRTDTITPARARELMKEHHAGPAAAIEFFQMKFRNKPIRQISEPSPSRICRLTHEPPAGFTQTITLDMADDEPCITIVSVLIPMPFTQAYRAITDAEAALEELKRIVYE